MSDNIIFFFIQEPKADGVYLIVSGILSLLFCPEHALYHGMMHLIVTGKKVIQQEIYSAYLSTSVFLVHCPTESFPCMALGTFGRLLIPLICV